MDVGIEAVTFQPGGLVLDLEEVFAPAKDEEPEKYTKGLGLTEISLPDTDEDIVTLGASAAHELMENEGLKPEDIGRIDVATESSFDRSKPASTYIAGCLEDYYDQNFNHANKGERKFACISGTQAVNDSLNWIQSGVNDGRKAIVIATDLAFYERGDPGESTQGAGAVAMLIDSNPSLTKVNRIHGYSSRDEIDFLKPNQQYPSVDGPRSVNVYLNMMREAIEDFASKGGVVSDFELAPFHTPFPAMVNKAAPLGYRKIIRHTGQQDEIEAEIGEKPVASQFESESAYEEAINQWMDELVNTQQYSDWFDKVVDPTIDLSSRVGNLYTGSVHLARLSGLMSAYEQDRKLAGKDILVASYGSGAQAEVHTETVQSDWKRKIEILDVEEKLDSRKRIEDFETYTDVHKTHEHGNNHSFSSESANISNYSYTNKGEMGERLYRLLEN